MTPLYTQENVLQYILKCENQKEVLQQSTLAAPKELKDLSDTYDLQIEIANKILNRTSNPIHTPTNGIKVHTLVFFKSISERNLYINTYIAQFANYITANNLQDLAVTKINSLTDLITVYNCKSVNEIIGLFSSEYIEIPNEFNQVTKRHMIPFIIGCDFKKSALTPELLSICNIIEVE